MTEENIILKKDKKSMCCGMILRAGTKVKIINKYQGRSAFVILEDNTGHKIKLRTN